MKRRPFRVTFVLFAVLSVCSILFLTGGGKAATYPAATYPCPCGCEECTWEVTLGEPLFALSKEHLVDVGFLYSAILYGEDAEKALDIINSFPFVR